MIKKILWRGIENVKCPQCKSTNLTCTPQAIGKTHINIPDSRGQQKVIIRGFCFMCFNCWGGFSIDQTDDEAIAEHKRLEKINGS